MRKRLQASPRNHGLHTKKPTTKGAKPLVYTKQILGKELKKILTQPHDTIKISRWAEGIYSYHCRELSPDLNSIIMVLSSMEHGPELEYTEEELKLLAELLINEDNDPIKYINEMKLKG